MPTVPRVSTLVPFIFSLLMKDCSIAAQLLSEDIYSGVEQLYLKIEAESMFVNPLCLTVKQSVVLGMHHTWSLML